MAETVNKGKKIFADKIRMMAKSIYDAADDIAGTTDGCVEISIEFDIETESDHVDAEFPTYTITRRHYPRKDLIDEFLKRMSDTSSTEEKRVTLSHDEALRAFGKCCTTCKYENDIDCMECNTCVRNPDLVYRGQCTDNWEDYNE